MDLPEWKITFLRPGRRRMLRSDRFVITVENLMMQSGLYWIGIGPRECKNEYHCILDTNQQVAAQVSKDVLMLEKM